MDSSASVLDIVEIAVRSREQALHELSQWLELTKKLGKNNSTSRHFT